MKVYRNTLGALLLVWVIPPLVLAAVAIAFGFVVSSATYKAVETYYAVALGMLVAAVALMLVSAALMTVDLRRGVTRKFRYQAFIPAVVLLTVATVMFGMVFHTVNSDAAYDDAYNYTIAMLALSAVATVYGLVPTIIIALVHSGKVEYVNKNELQARITERVQPPPLNRPGPAPAVPPSYRYGGSMAPPTFLSQRQAGMSAYNPPARMPSTHLPPSYTFDNAPVPMY